MTNRVLSALLVVLLPVSAFSQDPVVTRYIDEEGDRVPLHTVVPVYPREARRDRIEGDVQVCYHVDRRGRPYRVAVRSSSHRVFERPAMRAVRGSTYQPLADGEKRSGIKTCRTFRFRLDRDDEPADLSAIDTG